VASPITVPRPYAGVPIISQTLANQSTFLSQNTNNLNLIGRSASTPVSKRNIAETLNRKRGSTSEVSIGQADQFCLQVGDVISMNPVATHELASTDLHRSLGIWLCREQRVRIGVQQRPASWSDSRCCWRRVLPRECQCRNRERSCRLRHRWHPRYVQCSSSISNTCRAPSEIACFAHMPIHLLPEAACARKGKKYTYNANSNACQPYPKSKPKPKQPKAGTPKTVGKPMGQWARVTYASTMTDCAVTYTCKYGLGWDEVSTANTRRLALTSRPTLMTNYAGLRQPTLGYHIRTERKDQLQQRR